MALGSRPKQLWLCMCLLVLLLAQARFSLDELPEDDDLIDDPVMPRAPAPSQQKGSKGNSKQPSQAGGKPASKPAPPAKPAVAKDEKKGLSSSPSSPSSSTGLRFPSITRPKLSVDWSRTQGAQKVVVPSLVTVTVGALASTVWKRHGSSIKGLLGRASGSSRSSHSLNHYVLELEGRLMNLQSESEELAVQLTRVQASKTEELLNARSMVEQQKRELEALKSSKMQMQQEIESLKSSFQARLELVRMEASNHAEEADKTRARIEAEYRSKYTAALAKEQETIRVEVEKELRQTFEDQLKAKMAQCEKEVIAFYKQRIEENEKKVKEHYEKKLKDQEVDFRTQLDGLRGKFQSLYKEGIENQKEKMLERVKREVRRRPPDGERQQQQQYQGSSSGGSHHRQQHQDQQQRQHRSELPAGMEGYNLRGEVRRQQQSMH